MSALTVVLEKTGEKVGAATFDGEKIEAEGAAVPAVMARRRTGADDPKIWKQLAGSSNGYMTFQEQPDDQTAAAADRGCDHEFCLNPLHPGPCKGWKGAKVIAAAAKPEKPRPLRNLSDDQLADRFADISRQDKLDEPALRKVISEMEHRETPGRPRAKYAPSSSDRAADEHLEGGGDLRGALAAGVERRKGEPLNKAVARAHDEWIGVSYLRAEQATRGHMLSPAGKAAGIDPVTLFAGSTARARKYASEELQRWWADNPRLNRTQFRAQVLGRTSDRKAARATRAGSNGRDFI